MIIGYYHVGITYCRDFLTSKSFFEIWRKYELADILNFINGIWRHSPKLALKIVYYSRDFVIKKLMNSRPNELLNSLDYLHKSNEILEYSIIELSYKPFLFEISSYGHWGFKGGIESYSLKQIQLLYCKLSRQSKELAREVLDKNMENLQGDIILKKINNSHFTNIDHFINNLIQIIEK